MTDEHGVPPARDQVVATIHRLLDDWDDGPPPNWENLTVPRYLEALAAWLQSYQQVYINHRRPIETDGWEVLNIGLRVAATYE